MMSLIGMPEAARRMGVAPTSALRALKNANVPLVVINAKAYAVEETDLAAFISARGEIRKGRPKDSPKKAKD